MAGYEKYQEKENAALNRIDEILKDLDAQLDKVDGPEGKAAQSQVIQDIKKILQEEERYLHYEEKIAEKALDDLSDAVASGDAVIVEDDATPVVVEEEIYELVE